jgi:Tfp pilus assembly protein PilN
VKQLICIYNEGNDTKVAVVNKNKDKMKVLKTYYMDVLQPAFELEPGVTDLDIGDGELALEDIQKESVNNNNNVSNIQLINKSLEGINLKKSLFIPALTSPTVYYHTFEGNTTEKRGKLTQSIIDDIRNTKNVNVDKDSLSYIELSDKTLLTAFLTSSDINAVSLIKSLARENARRIYKIPSIKSADISLAYYVAKKRKFFPEDNSLIVYIGKEYSKLIFLKGKQVKHIGTALDIGTLNLHTYDVYFSKILLEMETGGISSLDNIIVCGEDDSENLILSFYGTFPEANVSRLEFDDFDFSELKMEDKESISVYSIPLAVAVDYFDEVEKEHTGINLLPKYIKEEQKSFQFGWHGYALFPLLFGAAFYITVNALNNNAEISKLENQIDYQTNLAAQNAQTLDKISNLQAKTSGFNQTQAILDSASIGTGVYTRVFNHISNFFENNKSIWLTKLATDNKTLILEGYVLSKKVLTQFAYSIKDAELKGVYYESLRDQDTYRFNMVFELSTFNKNNNEQKN